jgi:hypothetical protein
VRKLFKDIPNIVDRIRVAGGGEGAKFRGMRMADGAPVPVETIMQQFQVPREEAEKIARRMTR